MEEEVVDTYRNNNLLPVPSGVSCGMSHFTVARLVPSSSDTRSQMNLRPREGKESDRLQDYLSLSFG
ncbi:hypothetical protein E2C01_023934 [Portunus trituberculatus]|uniref:Uncharacterized protein n=1 Tax=Portunus trituberculatus TaxID=210409 RepID=A0A5B7EBV2_PORTR|nr:hypothetical protein [Portunus trituberculatus]